MGNRTQYDSRKITCYTHMIIIINFTRISLNLFEVGSFRHYGYNIFNCKHIISKY